MYLFCSSPGLACSSGILTVLQLYGMTSMYLFLCLLVSLAAVWVSPLQCWLLYSCSRANSVMTSSSLSRNLSTLSHSFRGELPWGNLKNLFIIFLDNNWQQDRRLHYQCEAYLVCGVFAWWWYSHFTFTHFVVSSLRTRYLKPSRLNYITTWHSCCQNLHLLFSVSCNHAITKCLNIHFIFFQVPIKQLHIEGSNRYFAFQFLMIPSRTQVFVKIKIKINCMTSISSICAWSYNS